jgi:plasmid stabilization system protein ParE
VNAIFHPEADTEFQEAIEYYEAESPGMGVKFYREVLAAVVRVEAHPKAWPRLRGPVRKCVVPGFPYKLLYTIELEQLHVVAVMHGKRQPGYWAGRLGG